MTAETHRVGDGSLEVGGLHRLASHVVELFAVVRQVLEVDRRWDDLVPYGKGAHDAFCGADGPEGMSGHRLRTGDQGVWHLPCDRLRLGPISGRGGCGVGVDVTYISG